MYAYTLKILALSVRDCRDNCLAIQNIYFDSTEGKLMTPFGLDLER